MDATARVTTLLRDQLAGERVVDVLQVSTRRWYTQIAGLLSRRGYPGQHYWWLVLTETRVLLTRREDDNDGSSLGWTYEAPRNEVNVERFVRTGIASSWLVLELGRNGRWSLHSLALFGFIPFGGSTPGHAKKIAEQLGWKPRSQR